MSGLTKEQHLRMTIGVLEDEVARLTRERNALLVSLVSAAIRDDADTERVLDDHAGMAVTIRTAIQGVVNVGWKKYLDLPSDLGRTS